MRIIDAAFQPKAGYVLDFSDRTFSLFFDDSFGIDIDRDIYLAGGTSKMNRLRTFCKVETPPTVATVLRTLWEYREQRFPTDSETAAARDGLFRLLAEIEGDSTHIAIDAIERFEADPTLDELVAAIERDIRAGKPSAGLDRLHTYCAKKFGHLLDRRGIHWERDEPLHSRVGKYVKALQAERPLSEMQLQILRNSIAAFDKFNYVRNNLSLAHDNELMWTAEAQFIFESINTFLRYVKQVDPVRFGT